MPFFSIVIATRNRPIAFRNALNSVLTQSSLDTEVIVVNDGSDAEHQRAYDAIAGGDTSGLVTRLSLPERPRGHGGGYAINVGADAARGRYLCFLDDDDCWIDPGHLARVRAIIEAAERAPDLVITDQVAFLHGQRRSGPIWLEGLPKLLARSGEKPDHHGAYKLAVETLLKNGNHPHVNTLIVRLALFREVGGMDELNRWEYDRDLYLRLIDRATVMRYLPVTVARHNIPDPAGTANMTTAISELERRLFQIRLLNRAALFARHPAIRSYARRNKVFTLKHIAELLAGEGRYDDAAFYAREALGAGPTLKWAGYTAWCALRASMRH